MKILLFILLCIINIQVSGQALGKVPDSLRQQYNPTQPANYRQSNPQNGNVQIIEVNADSLIKIKLVKLALKNSPALIMNEATGRIAEADYEKAKKSWLSSVAVGANINEFVVSNSEAASFFPKYNIGASVPLDMFSRMKREKKVAAENMNINAAQRDERIRYIKAEVLMRYENYKEKQEVVNLQRTYMEYDLLAYEAAKAAYAEGDIPLEDMNKAHQIYITEKSKMVSREKELNIAIIQLEELIGVPLSQALQLP
jgi:outer membrane protein TolC